VRNSWTIGMAVLAWSGWGQPPVKTPDELAAELARDLHGWSERLETPAQVTHLERPTGVSVSVAKLRHKIPRDAQKLFKRAEKYSKNRDHARAAAELEAAIRRDPEFADAYNNLGAEYGHLGRLEEAHAALRRSLELDSHSSVAHYNMGVILFRMGDISAAERSAKRALEESAGNAWAHYLLGCLLSASEATRADGLRHAQYAARSLPQARELVRSLRATQ